MSLDSEAVTIKEQDKDVRRVHFHPDPLPVVSTSPACGSVISFRATYSHFFEKEANQWQVCF